MDSVNSTMVNRLSQYQVLFYGGKASAGRPGFLSGELDLPRTGTQLILPSLMSAISAASKASIHGS